MFAEVVLPLPIDQAFTYSIPKALQDSVVIGSRVLVPFGNRKLTGYVVEIKAESDLDELKEVEDILDPQPVFSEEIWRLAHWMADYYICSLGEVLKAILPAGINLESQRMVRPRQPLESISDSALRELTSTQRKIMELLLQEGPLSCAQIRKKTGFSNLYSPLKRLQEKGYVQVEINLPSARIKPKFEKFIRLKQNWMDEASLHQALQHLKKTAPKQARCLELLSEEKELSRVELLQRAQTTSNTLKSLSENGFIEVFEKEVMRDYYAQTTPQPLFPLQLNVYQKQALEQISEAIAQGNFKTFLLHGVTGSGKTQVYIEAMARVLKKGKGAIVLVPEISLTPQTVSRFRSNFPGDVAVLHSRMSAGERYDSWRKIKEGQFRIAVGARSAIFAPVANIGLIVVDEEQEASYKQFEPNPRYHARDVAVMRAKLNNAVAILGSATPSAESYFNARTGKYHLLELPQRIDNIPMPEVNIIDMLKEKKKYPYENVEVFSRTLQEKIKEKLNLGEQIILLQNRRGFSTYIKCQDCGYMEQCQNCQVTLTYHLKGYRLRCHYCNFTKKAPEVCPKCEGANILFRGIGTQKVEEEVKRLFPGARLVRMDLDTTSRKWSHDRILKAFEKGEYDILLGTQMVAKGLDFQRVTLVGVISADTGLLLPDFRSSERTFQLLTQVAGRAGRKDLRGEVVIQTYSPDSYCLLCAKTHDFKKFFWKEIADRKELAYPPYGRLINILFKGEREEEVVAAAQHFYELLDSGRKFYQILGPAPSLIPRIQKNFRWQLILKQTKGPDPGGQSMRAEVRKALAQYRKMHSSESVKLSVDVDPINLF